MKNHAALKWNAAPTVLLATLLLVTFGCGKQSEPSSAGKARSSGQPQQLKVVHAAYVPAGYYLPFLVVKHQKLLEKQGYTMELQRYQDNTHMINLFLNGQLDVTAQSSFTMFPTEVDHPGLLKFVYGQYGNSYFFMVPSKSKVQSLQDMKGLTIGTWKSPTAVNFITILLGNVGLKFDEDEKKTDYKVQRFGATEWPAALENSVVPVVFGFDVPLARLAATGNYRYVAENSLQQILSDQKVFNGGAFVGSKLVRDDPQKAAAIRDALLEAVDIIRRDPRLTARIVAKTLLPTDEPLDARLPVAEAARFDEFTPPDEAVLKSAEQTLELLTTHGIVPKRFDVRALFWVPKTNTPTPK